MVNQLNSQRFIEGHHSPEEAIFSTVEVWRKNGQEKRSEARIAGINLTVGVTAKGKKEEVIVKGLFAIKLADNAPPISDGDTGAPVTFFNQETEKNEVIGLIVSSNEQHAFACPISRAMSDNNFELVKRYKYLGIHLDTSNVLQDLDDSEHVKNNVRASKRIAGVDLPESKKTVYALTRIAGIGITSARALCKCANIEEHVKFRDLTTQQFRTIVTLIADNFLVEGDLRRKTATRIKRLMDIGCYRGLRHRKSLPTRGQRTHTNARTRKGKPTPIAGKKK
tara:strand:- start:85 stop:924 length:840 start_codon:yes stop_codon:yes gene_type:complete